MDIIRHRTFTAEYHRGFLIHHDEEGGRRFFSCSVPDPSGTHLRQEFGSSQEARDWIDGKIASNQAYFAEYDPAKLSDRR